MLCEFSAAEALITLLSVFLSGLLPFISCCALSLRNTSECTYYVFVLKKWLVFPILETTEKNQKIVSSNTCWHP